MPAPVKPFGAVAAGALPLLPADMSSACDIQTPESLAGLSNSKSSFMPAQPLSITASALMIKE